MILKILCRLGLCLGGVVCRDGKAACNKCGYCSHYGKGHNLKVSGASHDD